MSRIVKTIVERWLGDGAWGTSEREVQVVDTQPAFSAYPQISEKLPDYFLSASPAFPSEGSKCESPDCKSKSREKFRALGCSED